MARMDSKQPPLTSWGLICSHSFSVVTATESKVLELRNITGKMDHVMTLSLQQVGTGLSRPDHVHVSAFNAQAGL